MELRTFPSLPLIQAVSIYFCHLSPAQHAMGGGTTVVQSQKVRTKRISLNSSHLRKLHSKHGESLAICAERRFATGLARPPTKRFHSLCGAGPRLGSWNCWHAMAVATPEIPLSQRPILLAFPVNSASNKGHRIMTEPFFPPSPANVASSGRASLPNFAADSGHISNAIHFS